MSANMTSEPLAQAVTPIRPEMLSHWQVNAEVPQADLIEALKMAFKTFRFPGRAPRKWPWKFDLAQDDGDLMMHNRLDFLEWIANQDVSATFFGRPARLSDRALDAYADLVTTFGPRNAPRLICLAADEGHILVDLSASVTKATLTNPARAA